MSTSQAQRGSSPAPSMATTGGEDIRRKKTRMVDEITAEFENLNIQIGDPHMEEKIPGGTNGERIRVLSNIFGVKMAKIPVFRYDITLSALFGGRREGKKLEFTKRSKEDSVVVDRKNMCRVAFECMVEKFKEVFGPRNAVYYDLQCILYTLQPMELKGGSNSANRFSILVVDCGN